MVDTVKKPLLSRKPIVVLLLLVLYPLGIFAIWKHNLWSVKARSIITAGFTVWTLLLGVGTYQAPPTLTLASVEDVKAVIKTDESKYTITGDLSSLHNANLKINDQSVTLDDLGNFRHTVSLKEGNNVIRLVATSEKGDDQKQITVYRTTAADFKLRAQKAAAERQRLIDEAAANKAREAKQAAEKKTKQDAAQDLVKDGEWFKVTSITDGDTIKVSINGKTETVRFIGIDTPETKDPKKPVQCYGKEASSKMQSYVQSKSIRLVADKSQGDRDKYKRLLRYVFLEDGRNVGYEMIRGGFAHEYTYSKPYKYQSQFKAAYASAKTEGKGFWAANTCNGKTDQENPAPVKAAPTPAPAPKPAATPAPAAAPAPAPASSCDPNYSPCVPNVGYDLDCPDIGFMVRVIGSDPHRFDRDNNGYGCESYG